MSERERWIVYPLLFLALGASLRDKIIKTTESQRIKCQGLCVFDSQDKPLLVLGPEQFPELFRPNAPNLVQVDEVISDRVSANMVTGEKVVGRRFVAPKDSVGILDAEMVVARNYVLTDGKNSFRIDGKYTVPLFRFITALRQQFGGQQASEAPAAATSEEAGPPASAPSEDSAPAAEEIPDTAGPTTGPTQEEASPGEGEPQPE